MRIEDLTDGDYYLIEKNFNEHEEYRNIFREYGSFLRYGWLKGSPVLNESTFKEALSTPFNRIPLEILTKSKIKTAVYKFRLEKGV